MPNSHQGCCVVSARVNKGNHLRLSQEQKLNLSRNILTFLYALESLSDKGLFTETLSIYATDLAKAFPEIQPRTASNWFQAIFGNRAERTSKPYIITASLAVSTVQRHFLLEEVWLPTHAQITSCQKTLLGCQKRRLDAEQTAMRRQRATQVLRRVRKLANV